MAGPRRVSGLMFIMFIYFLYQQPMQDGTLSLSLIATVPHNTITAKTTPVQCLCQFCHHLSTNVFHQHQYHCNMLPAAASVDENL